MTNPGTITGKKRGRIPKDPSIPKEPRKIQRTSDQDPDKAAAAAERKPRGKKKVVDLTVSEATVTEGINLLLLLKESTTTVIRKPRSKSAAGPSKKKAAVEDLEIPSMITAKAEPRKIQRTIDEDPGKAAAPVIRKPRGKKKVVVDSTVNSEAKSTTTTVRKPRNKSASAGGAGPSKRKCAVRKGKQKVEDDSDEEEEVKDLEIPNSELDKDPNEEEEEGEDVLVTKIQRKISDKKKSSKSVCRLVGNHVSTNEAKRLWPHRYRVKEGGEDHFKAARHYYNAEVDGVVYNLNDCCLIQAAGGELDYIGRIVEFFETLRKEPYVAVKWFFRPEDTVIADHFELINSKCLFASESIDVIPLGCIVSKIRVVQSSSEEVPECDFFCNMSYSEELHTFESLPLECDHNIPSSSSTIPSECCSKVGKEAYDSQESVMTLLDMYAGCGGMSTGLCIGAASANVNLVTRWAVDYDKDACTSLRHNHPETEVTHAKAEDFLALLKKWRDLCESFGLLGTPYSKTKVRIERKDKVDAEKCPPDANGEFELDKIIDICYGNPNKTKKPKQLYYKVAWKGWGSSHDSWEPASGLVNCKESIRDFVTEGYRSHILPLPGTVDVFCGGPPCQGISGHNRFRKVDDPLGDEKNLQLDVFMDIVKFLRPKFTLMENVVDLLKLKGGFLGRFAVGRLVGMKYQVRLGLVVAGSYGLPQYRQRAFLWGALPSETLPQFPLPTHKVISRGYTPKAFKANLVEEKDENKLLKALVLEDAISDLPEITTHELRNEMDYVEGPKTKFQSMIRLPKHELMGTAQSMPVIPPKLYDHLPLKLSADDNIRVSMIPKKKGANYRDLPGVLVDEKTNVATRDLDNKIVLDSGKLLVPEYALNFVKGKSKKPFGRLWDDETVSTVVGRAEPHNQAILHPRQDRVLSVRENARLQGFPDCYQFFGKVKKRYVQVGNAVAVPVGKALGFALGNAAHKISDGGQVVPLPPSFSS